MAIGWVFKGCGDGEPVWELDWYRLDSNLIYLTILISPHICVALCNTSWVSENNKTLYYLNWEINWNIKQVLSKWDWRIFMAF